jgi:SAM-dependent methyltransferase
MGERHDGKAPAEILVEYRDRLPKGKALDVAMGSGRHALYLAAAGWEVEGIERDPEAIAACREDAGRRGLSIRIQQADLETVRLPIATYDLVTCFYYLDRALIPQLRATLKPGGVIVYETFTIENQRRFGTPRRTEFCLQPNELSALFAGFSVIDAREGLVRGQYVAGLVARKPDDDRG